MSRIKIYILLSCFGFGICSIISLNFIAGKINETTNGFIRLFPPHKTKSGNILDIKHNSYYIAGIFDNKIYLGNSLSPLLLLTSNIDLSDTQTIMLKVADSTKLFKGSFIEMRDSNIYLLDGVTPALWRTQLPELELMKGFVQSYFTAAIPITHTSFIFRSVDKERQNLLLKESSNSKRAYRGILEKQIDGLFCTDGVLTYEANSAKLIYVYYYRNEFICMDSNVNVLYRARTKDTTSHAKIKVAEIKATGEITLASPPLVVNRNVSVNSKWIFIQSGLKANNEEKKVFDKCSVIDVYDLKGGKYQFSFYIPDFRGKKVVDFEVCNQRLYVLQDRYVSSYTLNF